MGGDSADWQAGYQDPLRWRFPDAATPQECRVTAEPKVDVCENESCLVKVVVMHRPTHDPAAERRGEYPYSWHLSGKKRLWELRLQMRFKRPPQGQTYFGVELGRYVPVTGLARGAQKALVSACQGIVGDCYHTQGDDPARVQGEVEAPAFVMPLWAFDQFDVSAPGEEPDLTGDMSAVGMRRSGDIKAYIRAMKAAVDSFSTDKVYTFCFWGVSKFLDVVRWRVKMGGGLAGKLTDGMDFNKLCGSPPVYLTMYELTAQEAADTRHLASRKRRFFHAEVWSAASPPLAAAAPVAAPTAQEDATESIDFDYWSGMAGFEHMVSGEPTPAGAQFDDLLGLDGAPVEASKATTEAGSTSPGSGASSEGKRPAESVDLLGLDFS